LAELKSADYIFYNKTGNNNFMTEKSTFNFRFTDIWIVVAHVCVCVCVCVFKLCS